MNFSYKPATHILHVLIMWYSNNQLNENDYPEHNFKCVILCNINKKARFVLLAMQGVEYSLKGSLLYVYSHSF
jgi:hypothetical protein